VHIKMNLRNATATLFFSQELCPVDFAEIFAVNEQKEKILELKNIQESIVKMMRQLGSDVDVSDKNIDIEKLKDEEREVVLLWAALHKQSDIIQRILYIENACNLEITTPEHNLTALHLAAYSGCCECVQLLIQKGVDVNSISSREDFQDTALHYAIKANSVDCVNALLQAGARPGDIGQRGLSSLHLACILSNLDCTNAILDFSNADSAIIDINQITADGRKFTALHLAAGSGFADGIRLLKEHGADFERMGVKGLNALHVSCVEQSIECAKLLVKECNVNQADDEGRTPLHFAQGSSESSEITQLLVNVDGAEVNKADLLGCTPLHFAALNEQSKAAMILIKNGADLAARNTEGKTALNLVTKKVSSALCALEEVFDSHITVKNDTSSKDVELSFNFQPLLPSKENISIHLLDIIKEEGHLELLQHPLCRAFLHLRWLDLRNIWLMNLFLKFIFLSTFSVICFFDFVDRDIEAFAMIIIIIAVLAKIFGLMFDMINSVLQSRSFFQYMKTLFTYLLQNMLEFVCLYAAIELLRFEIQGSSRNPGHGILFVITGWLNYMSLVSQHSVIGYYVNMYMCVLKEMGKVIMVYFCMLIGFVFSFLILFAEGSTTSLSYIVQTCIRVAVMMTGELEYNNMLGEMTNKTQKYKNDDVGNTEFILFYIVFSLFVLLVAIVLMNLLVAIAVSDVSGLLKKAEISKLKKKVDLIRKLEIWLKYFCYGSSCFCSRNRVQPLFYPKTLFTRVYRRLAQKIFKNNMHSKIENLLPQDIINAAYEISKGFNPYKRGQAGVNLKNNNRLIHDCQPNDSKFKETVSHIISVQRYSKYLKIDGMQQRVDHIIKEAADIKLSLDVLADDVKELKNMRSDISDVKSMLAQLIESHSL
jgi:ankyrin repeat protein